MFTPQPGTGCLTQNPMFVNPSQMNFALQAGSPCHNSGCEGYDIGAVPAEDMPAAPPYFSVNTTPASDEDVLLRWVNPTTTIYGNPIAAISAVHIWRNDSLIAEITDFSAGDTLEFTDAIPQPDYFRYYISATDNNGVKGWRLYSNEYWVGGPINGIVIWELDKTPITGDVVKTILHSEGFSRPVYLSKSTARYPLETAIDLVVVCLGIFPNNHVLTEDEGILLKEYLDSGGNVYMEGGDTWYFDPETPVHSYFHINATADGSDDLYIVEGIAGTPFEGMHFAYGGENQWMDHIEPISGSQRILKNYTMEHGIGIAYEGNEYNTIGTAFEFGGLVDDVSPSTQKDLFLAILEFFGIEITAIDEPPVLTTLPSDFELQPNYPNPFNSATTFSYGLPSNGVVELQIYDISGRRVFSENLGTMEARWHRFQWEGLTNQHHPVASGIYFYRFIYQNNQGIKITRAGKLHLIR